MDQARSGKRYATSQPLLVRCDTWGEFVALYAADISQGGMFVLTEDPPPVLSEVDVQLKLPEGHEIPLHARVVHVIEPAQAAAAQREPGVGIEFVGLDVLKQKQIHQLIEFARWQGTSQAPTATLASHMFEMNASATPAQVMQSLAPPGVTPTPREAIPAVLISEGETASSGVRRASLPAERESHGPQASSQRASRPASGAPRKRRPESQPVASTAPEAEAKTASGQPVAPPPPKPTDLQQLKVGMSHLAARRFSEATKHLQTMLDANPGDLEVTKWLFITQARRAIAANDENAASGAYKRVLAISEDVHEARKYVRELEQKKKLNSIPFGRFFVKKK